MNRGLLHPPPLKIDRHNWLTAAGRANDDGLPGSSKTATALAALAFLARSASNCCTTARPSFWVVASCCCNCVIMAMAVSAVKAGGDEADGPRLASCGSVVDDITIEDTDETTRGYGCTRRRERSGGEHSCTFTRNHCKGSTFSNSNDVRLYCENEGLTNKTMC